MAKTIQDFSPYTEERPWGSFTKFVNNEPVTVKILTVRAGEAFSLQCHEKRDEFWRIISGNGAVTIGLLQKTIKSGDDCVVRRGEKHRVEAGSEPVVILEIPRGDFDESNIAYFEDRYGRATID